MKALLIAICFFCFSSLAWGQGKTTDVKDEQIGKQLVEVRSGGVLKIAGYQISGISNDPTLGDSLNSHLVTEAAVKAAIDTKGRTDSLALIQDSILVAYDAAGAEIWRDTISVSGGNWPYSGPSSVVAMPGAVATFSLEGDAGSLAFETTEQSGTYSATGLKFLTAFMGAYRRGSGHIGFQMRTGLGSYLSDFSIEPTFANFGWSSAWNSAFGNLKLDSTGAVFSAGGTAFLKGIRYSADLSATFDPNSLVSKKYVDDNDANTNLGNANLSINNTYRTVTMSGLAGLQFKYDNLNCGICIDADPDASTIGLKTYNGSTYLNLAETGTVGIDFVTQLDILFSSSQSIYFSSDEETTFDADYVAIRNKTDLTKAPVLRIYEADNLAHDSYVGLRTAIANTSGAGYILYYPTNAPDTNRVRVYSEYGSHFVSEGYGVNVTTTEIAADTNQLATVYDVGIMQRALDSLAALSGTSPNKRDYGASAFTGTTIPDYSNTKQALQALESAVESGSGGDRVILDRRTKHIVFDDLKNYIGAGGNSTLGDYGKVTVAVLSGGASSHNWIPSVASEGRDHPGIIEISTGTTSNSTGSCGMIASSFSNYTISPGTYSGGNFYYEVMVGTGGGLNNTTTGFTSFVGFGNATNNMFQTNNILGFYYNTDVDERLHIIADSSGSETDTDLTASVGFPLLTDNTWYKFGIAFNSSTRTASFYINDVLVHTQNTNIHGGSCNPVVSIRKWNDVVTTARQTYIDYYYWESSLSR